MKYDFGNLLEITSVLRGDNGCPWDRKQNPASMKKYIIEEAYETTQAIDDNDSNELCEELGDLLFQVVFQAQMAKEAGLFDINDVIDGISRKMVKRHPHIFGGENADDYRGNVIDDNNAFLGKWEDNKKKEKGYDTQTEVLRAIPSSLPALMRAEKVLFKAENAGLDFNEMEEGYTSLSGLADEIEKLDNSAEKITSEQMGEIMLKITNISRKMELNTEFSLTKAIEKFINRFEYIESSLKLMKNN